jgi:NAD(P)-dependent dehydrogenase (short-subunit alcohol dehydrogenase family)
MATAIVTGASRGFGRALSAALAERGWGLVIDARGSTALERARRAIARDAPVIAVAGDITAATHRAALVRAAEGLGGIDALILNAGGLGPSPLPPLGRFPLQELRRLFEVNTISQLALVQVALPLLAPGAAVVAVTSDAAREAYPGWGGYGASKAALEQLAGVLGVEHPELAVLVVDPGDMRTRMHQDAFPGEDISDRPLPEERAPALVRLLEAGAESGRYALAPEGAAA